LPDIRKRLQAASAQELEALATANIALGSLADALGIAPAAVAEHGDARSVGRFDSANWLHVTLALGLELHVRDDASARVRGLVQQIRELCEIAESR